MERDNEYNVLQRSAPAYGYWRENSSTEGLILEAWGQGLLLGSLIIMASITVAAMRKRVLLHKFILLEQILVMPSGTYCFMSFDGYGWYVSATAALLYSSYFVHNVVAWMKVRPFFVGQQPVLPERTGRIIQWIYIVTLGLTIPVLVFQVFNDFRFNVNQSDLYTRVRPYEFVVKDPWWLLTNVMLLRVIAKSYGVSVLHLMRVSPRLGILLLAVFLAIVFFILDMIATILKGKLSHVGGVVDGINPYWKLSLVFKCLTDAIMLDDFATELKRIGTNTSFRGSSVANPSFSDGDFYRADTVATFRTRPTNFDNEDNDHISSKTEVNDDLEAQTKSRESTANDTGQAFQIEHVP